MRTQLVHCTSQIATNGAYETTQINIEIPHTVENITYTYNRNAISNY